MSFTQRWMQRLRGLIGIDGMPRNIFILGAGFTKAVIPDAPLNDELLKSMIGPEPDGSPIGLIWRKYNSTNLEYLLTQSDLELSSKGENFRSDSRAAVSKQLAMFMREFRFDSDLPWLAPLREILSRNDVIISLNYDCFLEGFLDFHRMWSPKGGYDLIRHPMDDDLPENDLNIRILKIHGSENFTLAPVYDRPEWAVVGFEIDSSLYPRSGESRVFGGGIGSRPYLIAPSFTKEFGVELHWLLLEALGAARAARNLVIIGCGLRWEDSHLWLILTSFMKCPRWSKKRTIIVDPNAEGLCERLGRFWSRRVFTTRSLVPISMGLREGLPKLQTVLND